jgi:hypothetical protein
MADRLEMVQNDTAVFRIQLNGADGNAFNLDGWAIDFTIKRSSADDNSAAVFHGTLAHGDIALVTTPDAGLIDVTVPAGLGMRIGKKYYWDCQVNKDGFYFTPCSGTIFVTVEATKNG